MNELINHKADCRTAPATPGLLKILVLAPLSDFEKVKLASPLLILLYFKGLLFTTCENTEQKLILINFQKFLGTRLLINSVLLVAQRKAAEVALLPFSSRLELVCSIKLSWPKAGLLGKLESPIVLVTLIWNVNCLFYRVSHPSCHP